MKRRTRNFITIMISLHFICMAYGNTIRIEGQITSHSGSPLQDVKVKVMGINSPQVVDSTLTDGTGLYQIDIGVITNVEEDQTVPTTFELTQNYPNPFSASTNINFSTQKRGRAELEVYNVLGQKIITLFDNVVGPSQILANWDGRDLSGQTMAKGIYFYRLTFGGEVMTKKMLYSGGSIAIPKISSPTPQYRPQNQFLVRVRKDILVYQITVSHPTIVSITDTLEIQSDETSHTASYSTIENIPPISKWMIEKIDNHNFNFNASTSKDDHDPVADLYFQCDLNEDGITDIPAGENAWQSDPVFFNTFADDGPWEIGIRSLDSDGASSDWVYQTVYGDYPGYPSDVISFYDQWKITLGSGSSVSNLVNYEHDDYFYNTKDDSEWVVYKTPNSGGTTPNSSNTRSELRQFSEWTPETGGNLSAILKVMKVSTSGDARVPATFSVVIGQIHSSEGHENEPLKIFYKKFPGHAKGSVFWNYEINTEGDNSERWDYSTAVWGYDWSAVGSDPTSYPDEPAEGIELGEEFSYEVNVYDGIMYLTFASANHATQTFTKNLISSEFTEYSDIPQQVLTVFAPTGQDGTEMTNAYAGELQYFKQGSYNQTNGKNPADNMVWNTGADTYGGSLTEQYANGSYAEVWFIGASVGPAKSQ